MNTKAFVIPDVTCGNIDRIERLLGVSFDPPRRTVLQCNESIDLQACPGSGKTTLLVAKLAILAGKWTDSRRGICVLSHTNVARQQIEQKLAATAEGQRLLSYPHFIGTIHSFINQFVALPCLRTEGALVRVIDDGVCGAKCRSLLNSNPQYARARFFLQNKEKKTPHRTITSLRYEGADLELGSAAGGLPCGENTQSYSILKDIKKKVADEGCWRYDDMFAITARQLKECPAVAAIIRQRFPVIFIDEMQDTSEMQNTLLAQLVPIRASALRQRLGDSNQAIYDMGQTEAISDTFPCPDRIRVIPNSKRFGSWIACVAEPLACIPVTPALIGEGPEGIDCCGKTESMPHTVFVFDEKTCQGVLPAFGSLLLNSFSDAYLRCGFFRAIGHVGKPDGNKNHFPRSLQDYWPAYEADAARPDPRPSTFAGYVHLAHRQRALRGESAEAVETVARGIVEIVHSVEPSLVNRHTRSHRWLQDAFGANESDLNTYRRLVWRWCIDGQLPRAASWDTEAQSIRALLRSLIGEEWPANAEALLQWSEASGVGGAPGAGSQPGPPNVFRFTREGRSIDIHVGTIHSAKGQTHTATLVLETHYYTHDLANLLDWLCGKQRGWAENDGPRRGERLRLIYTAMTRPTHLLCLAMHMKAFKDDLKSDKVAAILRDKGWRIVDLASFEP